MFSTRLHRARKSAGLSLRDLGALVGLSHAAIKKYEDGIAMPSSDILIRLSQALKVRAEYFFRPESLALEAIEYRKHSSLPKKRLQAITHEVIDQIERRIELENLFPQSPIKAFGGIDGLPQKIKHLDSIEDVAVAVRQAWQLGLNPIPDLIDVLETNGIRVFMIDTDADKKFDGLAAQVNGMPIAVVSRNWPGDRQRFTLAHELGHLVLQGRLATGIDQEKACNRFAGALLLPRESLLREMGEHRNALEVKELALLKEEFGLSMMSILWRALELKIISPAYRDEQAKLFRANGWNIKEPGLNHPSEKAHVFDQLVFHALAEQYIGESKAAELMGMSLAQFRDLRAMQVNVGCAVAAVDQ